jgi:hypothetical protein
MKTKILAPRPYVKGTQMNKIPAIFLALALSTSGFAEEAQPVAQVKPSQAELDFGIIAVSSVMLSASSPVVVLFGTAGILSESLVFFGWVRGGMK